MTRAEEAGELLRTDGMVFKSETTGTIHVHPAVKRLSVKAEGYFRAFGLSYISNGGHRSMAQSMTMIDSAYTRVYPERARENHHKWGYHLPTVSGRLSR